MSELRGYLGARRLPADPLDKADLDAYLIAKSAARPRPVDGTEPPSPGGARDGIVASTFQAQVKAFFAQCGRTLRARGQEREAARFEAASTHWLRHTHARHALQSGLPIELARHQLGHASIATTAIYADPARTSPGEAIRAFWASRDEAI